MKQQAMLSKNIPPAKQQVSVASSDSCICLSVCLSVCLLPGASSKTVQPAKQWVALTLPTLSLSFCPFFNHSVSAWLPAPRLVPCLYPVKDRDRLWACHSRDFIGCVVAKIWLRASRARNTSCQPRSKLNLPKNWKAGIWRLSWASKPGCQIYGPDLLHAQRALFRYGGPGTRALFRVGEHVCIA